MSRFPFYRDGKLYDVINDSLVEDREFFVQRAVACSGRVLEVACGTGRITIPIAQRGIDVVGLDVSKPMLSEARSKARKLGAIIDWVEADCRDFSLSKQFSLIFISFNSMLHLHDRTSLERFLSCVRAHLLPEGRFMFDIFNPSIRFLVENSDQKREVLRFTDPHSGKPSVIHETVDYDSESQVNRTKWFYSVGDEQTSTVHDLHLRCYFPQEIDALLHYNGFEVIEKLGDYNGTPFSSQSMKQIVTCQLQTGSKGAELV